MLRSLIQPAAPASVQPRWGGWLRRRDETPAAKTSGTAAQPSGVDARLPSSAVYAIVTLLIALSCTVNIFSHARDISWRLGTPHNLWEPALWEFTSGLVVVALVPLARRGAMFVHTATGRPVRAAFAIAALLLAFSALHLAGMGLLREFAYHLAGWNYSFPFAREALYEFRKDLFVYPAIAVSFWLAERPALAAPVQSEAVAANVAEIPAAPPELWLRDGRISILVNPCEITSVNSAGNYVEFQLTEHRSHLIRTTLQAQEARLAPFGITRVHRGRLVNLKRVVALEWRASGDFELRLDSGETVAGSRRFKAAVAGIAG
jgi:DNA-binding LytR/AlgR family response regulator